VEITIDGTTKTLRGWSKATGVTWQLISYRLKAGWPAERAVSEPARPYKRLDQAVVDELRRRVADGERVGAVARALGMSRQYAKMLVAGFARKAG
jgi:hypothetical protein